MKKQRLAGRLFDILHSTFFIIGGSYRLDGGVRIEIRMDNGRLLVVPRPMWDPVGTVIVVEFEGAAVERITSAAQ